MHTLLRDCFLKTNLVLLNLYEAGGMEGWKITDTCGDEVIHDVNIVRVNEVNALGVDAVLRRGHPEVIRLDVGAPGERQVVRLAVLQGDALHADPLAVLEVNSLRMKERHKAEDNTR